MTQMTIFMENPSEQAAARAAQARGAAEGAQEQAQAAREQAQAAREQAQAAREQAQEQRAAADEARQSAREAAQEGSDGQPRTVTISLPNGKDITLENPTPEALAAALGLPQQEQRQESDGPFVVAGMGIFASTLILIVALTLRYRAKTRGSSKASELPAELTQRMIRMETAIESVAIEVERISEGQRFTTRLLSERPLVEVPRG